MSMIKEIPISTNFNRRKEYKITPDEKDFLEWLLYKLNYYGFDFGFSHSRKQIESELGIKRSRLKAITKKFKDMGFLETEIVKDAFNNQMTKYRIKKDVLCEDIVLSEIIYWDSDFYREIKSYLTDNQQEPF